ncbi:sulfurtransferase [Simiduia curdlanivorans]|uniref:Sulfurtransferase n=1 Tax=Simiduia curdlanivorans TaxID=1492769 RepID=A0ABV8V8R1_9GAMM|nr:sulfurtransferase [Simiduia curdlanivorans]MDN3639363.1 sulfurtransferase [Simiduia curdlanivorans]
MPYLISAYHLNTLIEQKPAQKNKLVIFDCRFALNDPEAGRLAYLAGHIPGAHYLDLNLDLSSAVAEHGGRHPLPNISALQHKLQDCGVSQDSQIVLYDAHKGAYACRAWWLLTYCGIENVRVLNGGLGAWQQHFSLSQQIAETRSSAKDGPPLQLTPGQLKIRDHQDIVNKNGIGELIDSRELARFQGITEPIDPIAGHIPGAINLPWQTATDDEGFFLDQEAAKLRLSRALNQQHLASLKHPPTVYCGSGVTACVNIFAMAQLGIEAALYPGSWSDWCSYVTEENRSARVATS